jgi:hypothetical protein
VSVLRNFLATPVVAVVLGLAVGFVLAVPLLIGSRFASADKIDAALYTTMGSVMGGLLLSVGILFGYRALAGDGFVWFGPSLVVGFVVGLGAVGITMLRKLAQSDETRR